MEKDLSKYMLEVEDEKTMGIDLIVYKKALDEAIATYNNMVEGVGVIIENKETINEAIRIVNNVNMIEKKFENDIKTLKEDSETFKQLKKDLEKIDVNNIEKLLRKYDLKSSEYTKNMEEMDNKYKNNLTYYNNENIKKYKQALDKRLIEWKENIKKSSKSIIFLYVVLFSYVGFNEYQNYKAIKTKEQIERIVDKYADNINEMARLSKDMELLRNFRDFKINVSERINNVSERVDSLEGEK